MKSGTRSAWRFIRCLLLSACAGGILAADNTWLSSVNFEGLPSANWFSAGSEGQLADVSAFYDRSAYLSPATQKSTTHPSNAFLFPPATSASPALLPDHGFIEDLIVASPAVSADLFAMASTRFNQSSTAHTTADIASGAIPSSIVPDVTAHSGKSSGIQATPRAQISSTTALDPTWIGPSDGSWNNAANWSPATVPNGAGVIADFRPSVANATPMSTTQDVSGGATVGTLTLAGTAAQGWTVRLSELLRMNNSGNGAVISNVNTAAGNYQLLISGGSRPIILADNLAITNTSGSTASNSISINVAISGTGNVTFNNVSNNINMGQILLGPIGISNFVGTSTIASGAVVFSDPSAFGASTNQVILGSAGGGDATVVSTSIAFNFAHPVTVASGSGGTLVLGTISNAPATSNVFSGEILLNGDVSLINTLAGTAPARFTNTISGAGGITKIGAGTVVLSGNNTFTGATIINFGALNAGSDHALGATSGITVNSGGTLVFGLGLTDRIKDTAPLTLNGMDSMVASVQTLGTSEHGASNNTAGIGAVTLQSSSIIDLGTVASVIAFANSSGQTWTGILSIYNWSGTQITGNGTDQVYFGNNPTGLTIAQLNSINFYSDSGSTFLGTANWGLDLDGEIVPTLVPVPIPEPGTWIGGALALGAVAFAQRRRLRGYR
jgi:autotransporter-associated beta strand protein